VPTSLSSLPASPLPPTLASIARPGTESRLNRQFYQCLVWFICKNAQAFLFNLKIMEILFGKQVSSTRKTNGGLVG
jgi:hypothetical protein